MPRGAERRVAAAETRNWKAIGALLALAAFLPVRPALATPRATDRGALAEGGSAGSAERSRPSAPESVGLEAHGVDVRASLRGDLDVRDAFNRPVSRALVEAQLAGAARAADPTPLVSALPMIQAVWDALNRVLLGAGLRGGRPSPAGPPTVGWPWRLPGPPLRALLSLLALAALAAQALCPRPRPAAAVPANARPQVLRL